MSDIIDEIKDDLKEERYAHLWNRYGNFAIGAAIGVVVITAAVVWFSGKREGTQAEQGARYYEISYNVNNEQKEETLSALEEMYRQDQSNFSVLAGLKKARLLSRDGREEEASALYRDISDNSDAPKEMRALASLFYVSYKVNGEIKSLDEDDINERLTNLVENPSPWQFLAKEQQALLALRLGDKEKASALFEEIANDFTAPASLRERAQIIAQSIAS